MTAAEEARLVGAIDDSGPVRAADQLRDVQRMLRAGRSLMPWRQSERRDLVVDLTEIAGRRIASDEQADLDEVG